MNTKPWARSRFLGHSYISVYSRYLSTQIKGGRVSYPGEEAVYQASVEEAQAVEVRRKHAGAEEENHQRLRQNFWSKTMAGQKTKK